MRWSRRESPKRESARLSSTTKPTVESLKRSSANPLWRQLATRVQAKRTVNNWGDVYEQEADRVADRVMRTPMHESLYSIHPAGSLQRKCICEAGATCPVCEEEKEGTVQRSVGHTFDSQGISVPNSFLDTLGPGQPLATATATSMENRFGQDFRRVRVHTDARAAESAGKVNALAYTVGEHIVFQSDHYNPASNAGQRLLAHELVHVLQQRPGRQQTHAAAPVGRSVETASADRPMLETNFPGDRCERGPEAIAKTVAQRSVPVTIPTGRTAVGAAPTLQRQRAPTPPGCPAAVRFSVDDPVHVPGCGPFRVQTDVTGTTWTLAPDPTSVDPGTTIAANGSITIAATQAAGQIKAVATAASGCFANGPIRIRSRPTGIASTVSVGPAPNSANDYGAVFEHTFTSADGNVASLDNVAVGERFTNVPNPNAATHAIPPPLFPFGGTFTLSTATLTPNAGNNWFLTSSGQLGGNHDSVTIGRAGINVGHFVQSSSNPTPPQGLPATMTLIQGLHWFCPQAPAANRWRMPALVRVAHSRTLRNQGGNVEFVTTVNSIEVVDTYSGPLAVFNLNASPASTPRTPAPPAGTAPGAAPPARMVRLTVDSLPVATPAGQSIAFSIVGGALGCTVTPDPSNDHAADLTIGQTPGTVTVQAADSSGANRARVRVMIT